MCLLAGLRTPADLLMCEPSALLGRTDRNGFAPTTENQALSNWSDLRGHGARDYFYNWDVNETQTTTEGDGESQSLLNWWWWRRGRRGENQESSVLLLHQWLMRLFLGSYWKKKKKKVFQNKAFNSSDLAVLLFSKGASETLWLLVNSTSNQVIKLHLMHSAFCCFFFLFVLASSLRPVIN